jgi:chemotaxis protein histidine kinase CheA
LAAVHGGAEPSEIARTLAAWALEPASARLQRIAEQIESLAPRLGKPVPIVELEPTRLRVPSKKWAPFLSSLAHVVRNTVDHGLESAEERAASGKPAPSRVTLSLVKEGPEVVLTIADDGHGIDWEKLRARARTSGLAHETRAELEEALYADDVSTRDEITAVSGRGVGMSAVRATVRAVGGRIEVRSERGQGTTFRFVLPATMLVSDEPGLRRSNMPPRGNVAMSVRPPALGVPTGLGVRS